MWRHIPNIYIHLPWFNGHATGTEKYWRYLYIRPIFQAYVREYPHKIWYSTFIFGSWNYEIPIDPAWNPPSPHGILLRLTRHVGRALVKSSITWGWNIALWDMGEKWPNKKQTVCIMEIYGYHLVIKWSTDSNNNGSESHPPIKHSQTKTWV